MAITDRHSFYTPILQSLVHVWLCAKPFIRKLAVLTKLICSTAPNPLMTIRAPTTRRIQAIVALARSAPANIFSWLAVPISRRLKV